MNLDAPTQSGFQTTHWSLAIAAGVDDTAQSNQALGALFSTYWKPLYAFLRLQGKAPAEAQDLIQGFFETLVTDRSFFRQATPERGRFRSFLLGSLKNYVSGVRRRDLALKRGGDQWRLPDDVSDLEASLEDPRATPASETFDRLWASSCLEEALRQLEALESPRLGPSLYEALIHYISGRSAADKPEEIAERFDLSADAFKMKATRLRKSLREVLRTVVMETVLTPAEAGEELAYIRELLATGT